jgi:hypothetical protein
MHQMNYPSVTTVISPYKDFSGVNPEVLEAACQRGTEFHALAAAHLAGTWIPEVPANVEGRFLSFTRWAAAQVAEVIWVEKTLVHPVLRYRGTPDALLQLRGDEGLTLTDWKTPVTFDKSWIVQTAGYKELVEKNGWPVSRIATLQPHPGGGPAKFREFTKSLNLGLSVFISLLNAWHFFYGSK